MSIAVLLPAHSGTNLHPTISSTVSGGGGSAATADHISLQQIITHTQTLKQAETKGANL